MYTGCRRRYADNSPVTPYFDFDSQEHDPRAGLGCRPGPALVRFVCLDILSMNKPTGEDFYHRVACPSPLQKTITFADCLVFFRDTKVRPCPQFSLARLAFPSPRRTVGSLFLLVRERAPLSLSCCRHVGASSPRSDRLVLRGCFVAHDGVSYGWRWESEWVHLRPPAIYTFLCVFPP